MARKLTVEEERHFREAAEAKPSVLPPAQDAAWIRHLDEKQDQAMRLSAELRAFFDKDLPSRFPF